VFRILLDFGYTFRSIPRSMVAMRLPPFDPVRQPLPAVGHDFLAIAPRV
jgi:hypothetical protein